jgi:3-oxoacyl-[acyl-carrier protein] reductase
MEHEGKAAIVTGGGSGIGRATALALSRAGAAVALADLNLANAERVRAEIEAAGGRALAVPVDVAVAAYVQRLVARTLEAFGRLDILVCAAGVALSGLVSELPEADFDRTIAVHLKGTFLCCQAAAPHLAASGDGRVVNISSIAAFRAYPISGAYSAAKAGIIGLSKAFALEMAPKGVRVNVVVPGVTDTPMGRATFPSGQDWESAMRTANPLGRAADAADIANTILFLTSAASRHITGQTIHVNGGAWMP